MTNEFKLPDLGEGVHEGQIIRIHVAEGQTVTEDDPLMEVETDKAAVEIPSPYTGVVTKLHVSEDQLVHVGDVMVTFDGASSTAMGATASDANGVASTVVGAEASTMVMNAASSHGGTAVRKAASPAVRKLIRKLGLSIDTIDGSGPGGRITRADVERAVSAQPVSGGGSGMATSVRASVQPTTIETHVAASNLASNVGGGPAPPRYDLAMRSPDATTLPGTPGADQWGSVSRQPVSRARLTIAQAMNQSWSTIPHVTDCDDADVTDLDAMRKTFNAANQSQGVKLSLFPFVVRAVAAALRQHPVFNSVYDESTQEIVYRDYINIAVGVQTDRGLIAPVIRDADRLGVLQLSNEIARITEMARTTSFEVNDLRGGTFTLSNAGAMGGSRYATPLITPGQVAVLAVGRSRKLPWVVDDAVVPRLIMPLSVSFDHRIIDGAEEIAFQQSIIAALQNPIHLM